MRAPALAAVVLALALAVASAGCGSGSSDVTTTSGPLSAARWQREANAVCRDIGRRVRAVRRPRNENEISAFVAGVTPLWRREEIGIGGLAAPAKLAGPARDYLTALSYLEAALVEIHISTLRNDGARRFEAVNKSRRAARDMKYRATILRLPACAKQRIP